MKWIDLVPSDFSRMIAEGAVCVIPMGSLERHGEHIPFGCDLVVAETIASLAAERTPAIVFPGYFLAQVHEAACFTGTVNLPQARTVEVLADLLESIAANGFKKIVILNTHGGNNAFLDYFSMSQLDVPRDYVLYVVDSHRAMTEAESAQLAGLWECPVLGHACEMETSLYMACQPGRVRLDLADKDTVYPLKRFEHLRPKGIHNAHWWYADYPEQVVGNPAKANAEKGQIALELMVTATARALKVITEDTCAPDLQREFLQRVAAKGIHMP